MTDMLQRLGMDGKLWAEEMHKHFPAVPEDELLGWCCNMIMAGYDEAMRRSEAAERSRTLNYAEAVGVISQGTWNAEKTYKAILGAGARLIYLSARSESDGYK